MLGNISTLTWSAKLSARRRCARGVLLACGIHTGRIPACCNRARRSRLWPATFNPMTTFARAKPSVRRHLPPCSV